ncbi:hypothetical protein bcgnr5372_37750 [Bacillus luti]
MSFTSLTIFFHVENALNSINPNSNHPVISQIMDRINVILLLTTFFTCITYNAQTVIRLTSDKPIIEYFIFFVY